MSLSVAAAGLLRLALAVDVSPNLRVELRLLQREVTQSGRRGRVDRVDLGLLLGRGQRRVVQNLGTAI